MLYAEPQIFIYRPTIIVEEFTFIESQPQMQEQMESPIKFVTQSPRPQTQSGGIKVCARKI